MLNYDYLLNLQYSKTKIIYVIISIFLLLLVISLTVSTYDSYQAYGIYDNGTFIIEVPIDNSDAVKDASFIKLKDKKYAFSIDRISNLKVVNNINYQEYYLRIKENNFINNEVQLITFYYHKELIIKKIVNAVL